MTSSASGRHDGRPQLVPRLRGVRRHLGAVLVPALAIGSVGCLLIGLSTPWPSTAGPAARGPMKRIEVPWASERDAAPSEPSSAARPAAASCGTVTFEDARSHGVGGRLDSGAGPSP